MKMITVLVVWCCEDLKYHLSKALSSWLSIQETLICISHIIAIAITLTYVSDTKSLVSCGTDVRESNQQELHSGAEEQDQLLLPRR